MKPYASLYVTGSDLCTARMGGLVSERVGYHAGQHIRFAIRRQVSTVCNKQGQRGFRVNRRGAGDAGTRAN